MRRPTHRQHPTRARRVWSALIAAVAVGAPLACSPASVFPTEAEIKQSLDEVLRSAAGPWTGHTFDDRALTLRLQLAQDAQGRLTGSGTMREAGAAADVPVTVTGSYARPTLDLTIDGMVVEGHAVRGSLRGAYTTVGGVGDTLRLAGDGYARARWLLLQETP